MKKFKFLLPALSLVVITVGVAFLLAAVNYITRDRIAQNELADKKEAIETIFPMLTGFETLDTQLPLYVDELGEVYGENSEKIGYYVEVSPVGFKDKITMIVGIDTSIRVVSAVCLSSSETAGVATKATAEDFLLEFVGQGKDASSSHRTITGATITSKAVRLGIASACEAVEFIVGGEG